MEFFLRFLGLKEIAFSTKILRADVQLWKLMDIKVTFSIPGMGKDWKIRVC